MLRRAFSTYVVRMPRLSHVMKDGTVAKWYAQVEDHVVPHGLLPVERHPERRQPVSLSFVGGLDRDAEALRLAHAFQQATAWHRARPPVGA